MNSGATLGPQLFAREVVCLSLSIPLLIPQPDWDKHHVFSGVSHICNLILLGVYTGFIQGLIPLHASAHVLRTLNEAPWRLLDCIRQSTLALGSLADFRTSTNGKDTRSGGGRSTACVAAFKLAKSQCSMLTNSHVVFLPLHAMYWSARSRSTCAIMRGKAKC
jgi:hypothetical protein